MWIDFLISCVVWIVCGLVGIKIMLMSASEEELHDSKKEDGMKEFILLLVIGPCTLAFSIADIVSHKWHKIRDKHPNLIWNVLINREIKRRHKKRK